MGYATSTLAEGEVLIRRAQFNWTYNLASWFWFAFGVGPSTFIFLAADGAVLNIADLNTALGYACISAFVLGSAVTLSRYIHKWTTVIAVTTTRLIFKTGVISRTSHDISIEKIEEVDLHQSLFGRIFGYGSLIVGGEGVGLIKLPPIANPVAFLRDLEGAASVGRRRLGPGAHLRAIPAEREYSESLGRRVRRAAS